jgi:hypothetical protein
LAAAALRFVIYPTNEPEGDRAGFFSCVRGKMERTGRAGIVFSLFRHCFSLLLQTCRDRSANVLSPFRGLFARPRPPGSLLT